MICDTYLSAPLNEPIFGKWLASSVDEMDLLEHRLVDCGNGLSIVCTDGRIVCTDDDDGDTDTLSSIFVGFGGGSVAADRSLSVR